MWGPSNTYFLVLFTTIIGFLFALFCRLLNLSFGSASFFLLIFLLYCQILPCPFKSKIVWNYLSHNKSAVWIKSLWRAVRFPRHLHNRNSISLHLSTGITTNSCISQKPTNCAMKRMIMAECRACVRKPGNVSQPLCVPPRCAGDRRWALLDSQLYLRLLVFISFDFSSIYLLVAKLNSNRKNGNLHQLL